MKLPATVQVGAFKYKVQRRKLKGFVGQHRPFTQLLIVHPNLPDDQCADTMLHEVLHACATVAGIKDQEDFVNRMSPVLLDTFRRNPQLVKVLFA